MKAEDKKRMIDANRHIKEYLSYYISLEHSPNYAVLLNGPWGVGKTFLVRKFLREQFKEDTEYLYVSLYGLTSVDEIDTAVFQAMYPALGWKGSRIAGKVVKTAAKYFGVKSDIKFGDLANKFSAKLHIFDDIERCELPINTVLGYINDFVEHDGSKVLLVGNEKEIADEGYRKQREKIVGKTLKVRSSIKEALNFFISKIVDASAKKMFATHKTEIENLYIQSGINNLRILQQTMWDLERLYKVLCKKHKKNRDDILTLVRLFVAVSFEWKSGRIQQSHLKGRVEPLVAAMMARQKKERKEDDPFVLADRRYAEIELNNAILSDELLIDIIVNGMVDKEAIINCLDQGPYFEPTADESAWRVVWYAIDYEDNVFEEAYATMEQQFADRTFTNFGEILHVFGLRLWLSDVGVLGATKIDVVEECQKYVDDLYADQKLELHDVGSFVGDLRHMSHGGLGFFEKATAEFRTLFDYLKDRAQKAQEDTYPDRARILLSEMREDPNLFYRRLNITNSEDNRYYNVPLLKEIDPDEFVEVFLKLKPVSRRIAMSALHDRYENGRLDRELLTERDWLVEVREKLLKASEGLSPMAKYRIQMNVDGHLTPVLETDPS